MTKTFLWIAPLLFSLTACNLYSSMDKPSSDPQRLSAARACLDRADYVCAREQYTALSTNYNDVKLSELALTTMAENQVFSIRDLIDTLGSNRGGASSFALLAETMASRGKTAGSITAALQTSYASLAPITNTDLKAFIQFLTAYAAFNQVMSAAVGADGKLTASDIVLTPATCRVATGVTCGTEPACGSPVGSGMVDNTGLGTEPTTFTTAANWGTGASLQKLRLTAIASGDALDALGNSSYSGILDVMKQLQTIPDPTGGAGSAQCTRWAILTTLFP
jgi:hypothetical protein